MCIYATERAHKSTKHDTFLPYMLSGQSSGWASLLSMRRCVATQRSWSSSEQYGNFARVITSHSVTPYDHCRKNTRIGKESWKYGEKVLASLHGVYVCVEGEGEFWWCDGRKVRGREEELVVEWIMMMSDILFRVFLPNWLWWVTF